ncbi:hypothetical protein TNCV_4629231 [Trichonephila clavipes]|nr:hypothetical protein TNCV_4629231 [Trichonephila clavipes]
MVTSDSEKSLNRDISPSKNEQISAWEKLRDTVTGISVLHQSLQDNERFRTPGTRNSFMDLYHMNTEVMTRKKDGMASELRTLPPCTRNDCNEHKMPHPTVVAEDTEIKKREREREREVNDNKTERKKNSKKRNFRSLDSPEEFVLPKTAKPYSPAKAPIPVETNNGFSDLEQDVEQPISKNADSPEETID